MKIFLIVVIGLAVIRTVASEPESVQYFDSKTVKEAVSKLRPLAETKRYRVLMSNHKTPGQAEIHLNETDIIFCLEGEAEFVTGGKAIDTKQTEPNELRGSSISGGVTRIIKGGDILIIPAGTPHWFKAIHSAFNYSVVKIPQ